MYLLAEFRDQEALTKAIRLLKESGLTPDDLDLFSEEPVELRRGVLDRPSHMSLVAVIGAILNGSLITGFVYWAQHNYAVITGGMPVFSMWGTGVISYEMTMLGAVLATFLWLLKEMAAGRKNSRRGPIPLVPPGAICLRVHCEDGKAERAADVIHRTGGVNVEQKGRA